VATPPGIADVIVVGAGFGGLAAALGLAERGARVTLLEALTYPGGCASTFVKKGWSFEAGATLFSGFAEGQLMQQWIRRHKLDVGVDVLDPMIDFRSPVLRVAVPPRRQELVAAFCALPDAPVAGIRAFFAEQQQVADALWALFDDPSLLPPFTASSLLRHTARIPSYLPILPWVGRPLIAVLAKHGLAQWSPLRSYLDALCQITVQVGVAEAEAPFALAATDYCFRGTAHVHGGIGKLASALAGAIESLGGTVHFASRVSALRREEGQWVVEARGHQYRAPVVIANLLPQGLRTLLGSSTPSLDQRAGQVEEGWGAVMWYLGLQNDAVLPEKPLHIEVVADPDRPLVEGNHLFCSLSGATEARGPGRTATVSTHVSISALKGMSAGDRGPFIAAIQSKMLENLGQFAPEVYQAITTKFPASPRTWERFTRRALGCVGGIPRRAGLHNYQNFLPSPVLPGLWMVGDSGFPGQSTLGVALGGLRVAAAIS
jgi:phytoene dehydrogenase-like protein